MIIVNPGTERNPGATETNAIEIAKRICDELSLDHNSFRRDNASDANGWFRFVFTANGKTVDVDIPGDDPDMTCEGRLFKSRRLYVNGSSWLYGYAIGFISDYLDLTENEP